MKKPRLTEEEEQLLFELYIASTGRPHDGYNALLEQGLALEGTGRFGAWIKATAAGAEYIRALDSGSKTTRCIKYHERMSTVGRADLDAQHAPPEPVSPPSQPRRRRMAPDRPKPLVTASGNLSTKPNALRVILGARVTYYPVSSAASIKHGTQDLVVTSNKLYRAYPLAASESDCIVLA